MIKHEKLKQIDDKLEKIQAMTESMTFINEKIDLLNDIKKAIHSFAYDNGDLDLCIKNIVKAVDSYKEKTKRLTLDDLSKILTEKANKVIKESKNGK